MFVLQIDVSVEPILVGPKEYFRAWSVVRSVAVSGAFEMGETEAPFASRCKIAVRS